MIVGQVVDSDQIISIINAFQDVLSSYNELSSWKLDTHLPTDTHSIHNALIMRVSCDNRKHQWPLLVDPQHQAEKLVLAVQKGENHIDTLELLSGTVSHVKSSVVVTLRFNAKMDLVDFGV